MVSEAKATRGKWSNIASKGLGDPLPLAFGLPFPIIPNVIPKGTKVRPKGKRRGR